MKGNKRETGAEPKREIETHHIGLEASEPKSKWLLGGAYDSNLLMGLDRHEVVASGRWIQRDGRTTF